jgi:ABC-type antimicrobial peptide transport system permease subunit
MALGASTRDVRRLIVRQALATALPGVAAGVLLAGTLAVVARSALFGVGALDPAAIALAIFLLLLVVSAAAYGPSRRATRVDPAVTLRS